MLVSFVILFLICVSGKQDRRLMSCFCSMFMRCVTVGTSLHCGKTVSTALLVAATVITNFVLEGIA
jgi:hypothetical protein